MAFTHQHLLGLEGLSREEILFLIDTAESFKEISERDIKKVPTLRGKTVVGLFYEASTRTRTSFEIAAKRLSADYVSIAASNSSATKGETLLDTARNLAAMRPDCLVMRHNASGAAHFLAFTNVGILAEQHRTDLILFEVHGDAGNAVAEIDEFAGHNLFEAMDTRNTVADGNDGSDFAHVNGAVVILDLLPENISDLVCPNLSHRISS